MEKIDKYGIAMALFSMLGALAWDEGRLFTATVFWVYAIGMTAGIWKEAKDADGEGD